MTFTVLQEISLWLLLALLVQAAILVAVVILIRRLVRYLRSVDARLSTITDHLRQLNRKPQ